LVDFKTLLAYTYKASQHAFDFATFLAETAIGFGIKPAHIMGDP
jgi:hypothetical protein